MSDEFTTRQRVRAAMALAGYGWDALAAKIERPGFSQSQIRKELDSDNPVSPYLLDAVARACRVRRDLLDNLELSVVGDLEARVDELSADVERLDAARVALAGEITRHTKELLEIRSTGHQLAPPAEGH